MDWGYRVSAVDEPKSTPKPLVGASLAMRGKLSPEFQEQELVPKGTIPRSVGIALSVVGVVGGSMIGAYFGQFGTPELDAETMQALAARCVSSTAACESLQLAAPNPLWLLVVGGGLLSLEVAGKVPWAAVLSWFSRKKS
jgi:hypothetical protein